MSGSEDERVNLFGLMNAFIVAEDFENDNRADPQDRMGQSIPATPRVREGVVWTNGIGKFQTASPFARLLSTRKQEMIPRRE